MKRGEIYYIERTSQFGSEQIAGRPAVIVSNDRCNLSSEVVEIVYLTTQPKTDLATHVVIRSTGVPSTVLCEQITSVSISRVGRYVGTCTEVEMELIDQALAISLDIDKAPKRVNTIVRKTASTPSEQPETDALVKRLEEELTLRTHERDFYEKAYNRLIDKLTT